jgi:DNA-binding transcriptional MerR regulator
MPNRGRAPESPTSPRRLKVRERALQALEMRKAGASFEQIRVALAYSDKGSAYRSVMGLLTKQTDEAAEPLRRLEVERCDKLQLAVWQDAVGGDLKAVDTVLRIMERRARLLGLDKPVKVEARIEGTINTGGLSIGELGGIADLIRLVQGGHPGYVDTTATRLALGPGESTVDPDGDGDGKTPH